MMSGRWGSPPTLKASYFSLRRLPSSAWRSLPVRFTSGTGLASIPLRIIRGNSCVHGWTLSCIFVAFFRMIKAGDGDRTHVSSLEGLCSTTELLPPTFESGIPYRETSAGRPAFINKVFYPYYYASADRSAYKILYLSALAPLLRSSFTGFIRVFSGWKKLGREGFEPSKANANRFTVCPLWPLGYLPIN
jgi:hypothetical protein